MCDTGKMKDYTTRRALAPFFAGMPRREATEHFSMASEIAPCGRNDNTEGYAVLRDRRKRGNPLGNEDGIALVTALMLGLFGMMMVAALLFMVNTGTWTSGSQKRYQTALAAAYGANDFFVKEVIQRGVGQGAKLNALKGEFTDLLAPVSSDDDFTKKLTKPGNFSPYDPNDPTNKPPDATITFPAPNGPGMTVKATIVSTSLGNSGASADLPLLPNGEKPAPAPTHIPFLFQIQVVGQNDLNPNGQEGRVERARLNSVYVY